MKTKIGINGFGRIGRNAFKLAFDRDDIEVVAVNDLSDTKTLAHLLKHDSNYGTYDKEVSSDEQNIIVEGKPVKVLAEKDPAALPWSDLGVDIVIESTGLFVDPAKAKAHIDAGAKKVIISAPAKGEGSTTIVLGVNEDAIETAEEIINCGSCTTNCVAPVMAILVEEFGVEKAMLTTVHSYTASQKLQDAPAKDLREARNAATNIVPTTTGASISVAQALPEVEGIFEGLSIRVPTQVVSIIDIVAVLKKDTTVDEVNAAFKKAAADPYYQGILDATEDELVSSDYIGNSHSAIVDLPLTHVVAGNMVKVAAWYDNEWGYSNRLIELTADVAKALHGGSEDSPADEPDESEADEEVVEEPVEEATEEPTKVTINDESDDEEEMLPAPEKEELLEAPKGDDEEPKHPEDFEDPGAEPMNIDGVHRF